MELALIMFCIQVNLKYPRGRVGDPCDRDVDRGPLIPLSSSLNTLRHIAIYICSAKWICNIYCQVLTKLKWANSLNGFL